MPPAFVRRPIFWAATLPLTGILVSSVISQGGLLELRRLYREREAISEEAFRLMSENESLRRDIVMLRRSERALERLARQELGLIRDGDIVYRFRSRQDASSQRQPP